MQTQIKPWMLAYTIIFGLFSIGFVYNDFTNQYPLIITTWAAICYVVIFIGNLLYSLNRVPLSLRAPWKIVFPLLMLQFAFAGIYDSQYGKHAHDADAALSVVAWTIDLLLFLPTFCAHYKIGYRRHADPNVA